MPKSNSWVLMYKEKEQSDINNLNNRGWIAENYLFPDLPRLILFMITEQFGSVAQTMIRLLLWTIYYYLFGLS